MGFRKFVLHYQVIQSSKGESCFNRIADILYFSIHINQQGYVGGEYGKKHVYLSILPFGNSKL